ncbi:MAG: HEXXH motif-containing putative peptide modification protein [Byssovorax sp.]
MAVAPLVPPRDLTIPEPGSTTARAVLSAAMRRLALDLQQCWSRPPKGARGEAGELAKLVSATMRATPGALVSVLRRPTVGALIRCVRNDSIPGREALFVSLLAHLAFELALLGALPAPVRLRRVPAHLLSITARLAIPIPAGTTAVLVENGQLTIEGASGPTIVNLGAPADALVERPYHALSHDIVLALADNNPLAMEEAHPNKSGNAIDLGGEEASAWTAALAEAFALIERHLPDLRAEMDLYLHQIVPVGWDAEKHLSASYQEAIGTIYMSLHPSGMTLAEALIHEFSHNKLNALFEVDEVLENAWSPLYASPVRPDPRPLHGVLLAVHAFLPVARLYEKMIEAKEPAAQNEAFLGRFAAIRRINREGAEIVLEHGKATVVGAGLLEEIRRWDGYYARWG